MRTVLVILLCLQAALADPSVPDRGWLDKQSSLKVQSRTASRVVYRVKGSGDRLFSDYRARLKSSGWTIIQSVWSGPMRYLRAKRETTVADVTLQNSGKSGKLTIVVASTEPAGKPVADKIVDQDEMSGTYVVKGGAFALNAEHCDIVIRGTCSIVRINGSHNTVRIEAATASILVNGNDNHVRWKRAKKGPQPVVTNAGTYNVVESYQAPGD